MKGEDLLLAYADNATDSGETFLRNSCSCCGSALTLVVPHRRNMTGIMVGSVNEDVSEEWKPQLEIYCKARPKWLPDCEVIQHNTSPVASEV